MTYQPSLFEAAEELRRITEAEAIRKFNLIPRVHARRTDPYTSDQALKAIAKDKSLMNLIWFHANVARAHGYPFNDTWLTVTIENQTGIRQQRNVIARSRGLLEQAGMIRQVGVRFYGPRALMHYEIDPNNPKENSNG